MALNELSITELVKKYKEGGSALDACTDIISAVESDSENEKPISAYNEIWKDEVLSEAEKADVRIKNGEDLPLLGVPISIKDNIAYENHALECSSKILRGYKASYNAFVVDKLKEAGAVILGRLNMDEFAMGSSTETSSTMITRNPHNRDKIPGGSSGGCAAATAANHAIATLGSDTGGSIRQPASLCGVVGLKPTYGRVSRRGLVAFGSSLDQIGPITKTVDDASLLFSVINGYDKNDSTSMNIEPYKHTGNLEGNVKGLKIGLPKEYFVDGVNEEVKNRVSEVVETYKTLGAEIKEISLPHTEYGVSVYYIVATAEASSNLARFDGIRYGKRAEANSLLEVYEKSRMEGFGSEVKRRILLGTYVLSSGYYDAYYLKALKVRTLIKQDFEKAFGEVDVILTPTTPTTAFGIGEKMNNPISMYLSDIFTITVNLAGIPSISVPAGKDSNSLPIGFQLMGNYFEEGKILNAAMAYEKSV